MSSSIAPLTRLISRSFGRLFSPFSTAASFPAAPLRSYDSGQVRIDRIAKIIAECRLGTHDISRTELDSAHKLPRFNMPLELGMFLGAQRFGSGRQKRKNSLILDIERYRYQKFISDIAGQDISAHDATTATLIGRIRDWLRPASGGRAIPGGAAIVRRFEAFQVPMRGTMRRRRLS